MKFYARAGSWQFFKQVASDLFMVAWAIGWWVTSRFVDGVVRAFAIPARKLSEVATGLSHQFTEAGTAAGKIPLAGDDLRKPLDGASASVADFVAQLNTQVHQIEHAATVSGWLVFLIPVVVLLLLWLPARLRFRRKAVAAQHFIDSQDDLDLFALRAMATLPMHELAKVSADPVGEWRAGNQQVIAELAELGLAKEGLRGPRQRRITG